MDLVTYEVFVFFLDVSDKPVLSTTSTMKPKITTPVADTEEVLDQPAQFGYLLILIALITGACWRAHVPLPAHSFA